MSFFAGAITIASLDTWGILKLWGEAFEVTFCEKVTNYDSSSVTNDITSQEKVYCPGYMLG